MPQWDMQFGHPEHPIKNILLFLHLFTYLCLVLNFTAFLMQQLLSLPLEAANKNEKKSRSTPAQSGKMEKIYSELQASCA